MRKLIVSVTLGALLLCGCGRNYRDTSLYQLSGRQKPIVAVLPVIDNSDVKSDLPWDLSQELTDEIRKRIFDSKKLYLLREGGNLEIARRLSTPHPEAIPSAVTDKLGATEFVVVAEIMEQDEESYGISRAASDHPIRSEIGAVLSLALRVRVIDIREETPKVILQEVLDQEYIVSRAYMNCDYEKMAWGTESFNYTPMGMAHNRLVREIVSRIESYIESAQ